MVIPADRCDEPIETFQAFSGDVERMADCLVSLGIETVAIESTCVYWGPVYEVLQSCGIELIVANARETLRTSHTYQVRASLRQQFAAAEHFCGCARMGVGQLDWA